MHKPPVTSTTHILPFLRLDPRTDFERLCLWLVEAEGYEKAEHYGLAGSEQGRDVIAYIDGDLWYFQCKRHKSIATAALKGEIDKIAELSKNDPDLTPKGVIFVIPSPVSAQIRDEVRAYCRQKILNCEFWAETELDLRVKKHTDIVAEFFGITSISDNDSYQNLHLTKSDSGQSYPYTTFFVGRANELRDLRQAVATSNTIVIGGVSGIGKTYFLAHSLNSFVASSRPIIWLDCSGILGVEQALLQISQSIGDEATINAIISAHVPIAQRMNIVATLMDDKAAIVVLDDLDYGRNSEILELVNCFNRTSRSAATIITCQQWIEADEFLNPVHVLTLTQLSKSESFQLLEHFAKNVGVVPLGEPELEAIYQKVSGHPYYLRLLISHCAILPLDEIVNNMPNSGVVKIMDTGNR